MFLRLVDRILWCYWAMNRPFLRAFSVALIGRTEGPLDPHGDEIVTQLETLLKQMTRPVFRQAVAVVFFLPIWVPERLPYAGWKRVLLDIWAVVAGQFVRFSFLSKTDAERGAILDRIFLLLSRHVAEQEDEILKPAIMMGLAKTLLTSAYLDLDRTWKGLDYLPFTPRTWYPPSGPDIAHPPATPNSRLLKEKEVADVRQVARKPPGVRTYLVIGSGAGGGTAAYYIKQHDKTARIVMLDSGPLATNEILPQHLMTAAATLYMNGGVTLSADQKTTFVQARCVGGGTLVNNSVALKPEGVWWDDVIVKRWSWLGADLNFPELHEGYDALVRLLNVVPVPKRVMTPMAEALKTGFEAVGAVPKVATCNVLECVGCGRCNVGCSYGAKQSMIETTIPEVVRQGGFLVPNAHVTSLALEGEQGQQTCIGAHVRTASGDEVLVEADKILLAAGAFASTKILRKSGFKGANPGVRTVGRRFSGNMGTPLFGEFDRSLRAWDGLQVAYLVEMPQERVIIETAFAPPPAFGLQAPQWGQRFMNSLQGYDRLAVACPVVATSAYGDIVGDFSPSGYSINYAMVDDDWYRLALGLKLSAEAMLAAGARTVYSTRFDARTLTDRRDVDRYFAGTGPLQYLKMTTAHLQGGNVISSDPNLGVVDADLKVHGIDRLWITDASVIPAPITLNVQLTVMALAHYAASRIVHA